MRSDILFRIRGAPVFAGALASYIPDPDTCEEQAERIGMIVDFVWDDECKMHLVHFLHNGEVILLTRSEIRLI